MRITGVVVGALLLSACGGTPDGGTFKAEREEDTAAPVVTPEEPASGQPARCQALLSYPDRALAAPALAPAPEAALCGEPAPLFATPGSSAVAAPFGFTGAPACVPVEPGGGRRFAHACREDQFTGCGQWVRSEFFDAEGRPQRSVVPVGEGVVETRRAYEAGQLVQEETLGPSGYRLVTARFSPEGHELLWRDRWRDRAGDHCTEATRATTLNEWGAPAFTVYDGEERMTYAYDGLRRLIGVDGYLGTRTRVYAEEGWLARETDHGWYHDTERHFDAQGRPTHVSSWGMGGTAEEELSYGPHGVVARWYRWEGGSRGTTQTEISYDGGGLPVLEWQSTDGALHVGAGEVGPAHERVAIRRTFTCAGDLLREEVDRDLDGEAESRTEYERDAEGNLLSVSAWEGDRRTRYSRYQYVCD